MDQDAYEKVCSVCHRPESVAGKLMRLPMNMYLCPECMDNVLAKQRFLQRLQSTV